MDCFISAKRSLSLLVLLCFFVGGAFAAGDSITVYAYVADAFTDELVEDGEVDVLSSDSSLVCKGEWGYNTDNGVRTASLVKCRVPSAGRYILRVSHPAYLTAFYPADIRVSKRSDGFVLLSDKIFMSKRPKDAQLGGVTIRATKIKMVMKKDTIVYDADAFRLSQGSMLDALIEQLPGVELKDNGVITVNGKPVSSLLVNGKDFFRGDPKIALENLPAYMVDKVKVYEQQSFMEKMTGRKELDRPLVMDVNLKKQYSVGWIANAEAAYGTRDKFLGRLFAMRFTDCSRLALFGNVNNTNDTRRPGQRGDWTPSYLPDGVQTSRTGGAEYYYGNRKKTFEWTSNFNASHSDNNTLTRTSRESFLPTNRAFGRSLDFDKGHFLSFNTKHGFKVEKNCGIQHTGNVYFNYDRNRYNSLYLSGEFSDDPYSYVSGGVLDSLFLPGAGVLSRIARYRRSQELYSRGTNWSVSAPYHLMWLPFFYKGVYDMVIFDASGAYDKHTYHQFDNYDLRYFNTADLSADYRNRYATRPSLHYKYDAKLIYHMQIDNIWPQFTYRYSQDYRNGRTDLYRLDRLEGWGEDTDHGLGMLPSASSDMQEALDIRNSEHSRLWKREHLVEFKVEYRSKKKNQTIVVLTLPMRYELDHLIYDRSGRHFDEDRSKALFIPNALFQQVFTKGDQMNVFKLNYAMSSRQPDLVRTIDLVNDANPLYIERGNPSLRRSITHDLAFEWINYFKYAVRYNLSLRYQRTNDALATERTYNPVSGGYTVRPVNVDGNWRTEGKFSLNRQFGKNKEFSWGSNTSYSFDHNVDMANVDGALVNGLSTIKNLYLGEQLSLSYSQRGWNVGAKVRGSYNRLTGSRTDFSNINAWDYNYGLTARVPLPLGFGLSTDFTVFSRRGYGDRSLNTDDLIWNMRLERSVMHGNLTLALDGFDLLHELSKVTRVVNAQGRTESYTNVMPAYFMLHAIYRLNKQPKKKE